MKRVGTDRGIDVLRRVDVLRACRDGAVTRGELADRIDLSRTTAYRATVDLEERGLLEQRSGGYRTTVRGAALVAASERYLASLSTISHLGPLFDLVDHPELVEHAHLLTDADVVVADATNPYRVVERTVDRFEKTARSRGTLTNVSSVEALDRVSPTIDEKDAIERIFAERALEAHETVGGTDFETVTRSESVSLFVADDDSVPFSFAIDDDRVTIVGHDPATGLPTVHVESRAPAARTWLEGLYDRCLAAATPL